MNTSAPFGLAAIDTGWLNPRPWKRDAHSLVPGAADLVPGAADVDEANAGTADAGAAAAATAPRPVITSVVKAVRRDAILITVSFVAAALLWLRPSLTAKAVRKYRLSMTADRLHPRATA
jgi:hypothetical protein